MYCRKGRRPRRHLSSSIVAGLFPAETLCSLGSMPSSGYPRLYSILRKGAAADLVMDKSLPHNIRRSGPSKTPSLVCTASWPQASTGWVCSVQVLVGAVVKQAIKKAQKNGGIGCEAMRTAYPKDELAG